MRQNSTFDLKDLQEKYDLELDRIANEISGSKVNSVLFQLPDGLKPYSLAIVDYFSNKFPRVSFSIWLGSCFGACDTPEAETGKDTDLIIQFGHAKWK
ncbi:MAG: diphthamide synthesis protein [archaeon]